METLHGLEEKHKVSGLVLLAVHMPMNEFDTDINLVRIAAREMNLIEPCIVDEERILGNVLGVDCWPYYFLFGANSKLKRRAKGATGLAVIERALTELAVGNE